MDLGPHLVAKPGIEIAQRFVEENDVRAGHKGSGQSDPLLLTAAQLHRVAVEQCHVAAHASGVVDIAGLGHPHHRVDEQLASDLASRAPGELQVGAVHGIASLERDDATPAGLDELGTQLCRSPAEVLEVVVCRRHDALEPAPDAGPVGRLQQLVDTRVLRAPRAVDGLRLETSIGPPDGLHPQRRQHHALGVAQRQEVVDPQPAGDVVIDVEGDGNRPQGPVGQAHGGTDGVVVRRAHEAGQR